MQTQVFGKHTNSNLIFNTPDGALYVIELDGQSDFSFRKNLNIERVSPGKHFIRLFKNKKQGHHHYQSRLVAEGWINIPVNSTVYSSYYYPGGIVVNQVVASHPVCPPVYSAPAHNCNMSCGHSYMMNPDVFNQLKLMVSNEPFDNNKLKIAKQAISANGVSSAQVRELIGFITFESNKLELAKFAYGKVFDKENYFMVNDGFTFSSSVNALADYIGTNM